jgi:hypothetical protein
VVYRYLKLREWIGIQLFPSEEFRLYRTLEAFQRVWGSQAELFPGILLQKTRSVRLLKSREGHTMDSEVG